MGIETKLESITFDTKQHKPQHMEMTAYYQKQIDFEKWANDKTIEAILTANNPPERALQVIAHILGTFSGWIHRINNEHPTVGKWDTLTHEQCLILNNENHHRWIAFITQASELDFERIISFDLFGQPTSMNVHDIIVHAINHGSYHRGQIIISLKNKLEKLPLTTYVAFLNKTT